MWQFLKCLWKRWYGGDAMIRFRAERHMETFHAIVGDMCPEASEDIYRVAGEFLPKLLAVRKSLRDSVERHEQLVERLGNHAAADMVGRSLSKLLDAKFARERELHAVEVCIAECLAFLERTGPELADAVDDAWDNTDIFWFHARFDALERDYGSAVAAAAACARPEAAAKIIAFSKNNG